MFKCSYIRYYSSLPNILSCKAWTDGTLHITFIAVEAVLCNIVHVDTVMKITYGS